ncbi:MAG: DUF1573 domain-containing protein [Deltaproteobacteria bacterium]|nr:DUF1573 domain-containing protein [Deltaproteobacteria bacterium]
MLGQRDIKPGETAELKISYNTYKFPGKFEKYVTVFIDQEHQERRAIINLVGYVEPVPMGVLDVDPRKVSAGEIKINEPVKLLIMAKNTGDADLEITKVESKKSGMVFFDGATSGNMIIRPGEIREIPFEIVGKEAGRLLDYIMIYSNARNVTEQGYKVVVIATVE